MFPKSAFEDTIRFPGPSGSKALSQQTLWTQHKVIRHALSLAYNTHLFLAPTISEGWNRQSQHSIPTMSSHTEKKRHSNTNMPANALREQIPVVAAQHEEDDSGSPTPGASWSDDAFHDDEEGGWTPVFPKKWGQKKKDPTAGKEDAAVKEAAAQLIALSTAGITDVESSKAGSSVAAVEDQSAAEVEAVAEDQHIAESPVVAEDQHEAASDGKAEDQHAAKSTATIEKKKQIVVPVVGKNHERNQKRKNKKRGTAKKRVKHLVEDAANDDHKEEIPSTHVEDSAGDVHEAKTSPTPAGNTCEDVATLEDASPDVDAKDELCSEPPRSSIQDAESSPTKISDTDDDVAKLDASSDVVATAELCSEDIVISTRETESSPTEVGDINGDVAQFDASSDEIIVPETDSEPACASDEDYTIIAESQKLLRADSMMGDMPPNSDPSEMSGADPTEELCATNEDDEVFLSVEETIVSNKKQARNARRNQKRSLAKKNKKAAIESTAVVSRLSIAEGHKLVAAFFAGVVFDFFVTYMLGFWVRG